MYCPQCHAEFREGFTSCNTCEVPLVEQLPSEESHEGQEMVSALATTDPALIPVLGSVLEAASIPHFIQGEEGVGMLPVGPLGGAVTRRTLGVRILVPKSRLEEARALLEGTPEIEAGSAELLDDPDGVDQEG